MHPVEGGSSRCLGRHVFTRQRAVIYHRFGSLSGKVVAGFMGSQVQHRVKSVVYRIHQVQETESHSCKIWRLNSDLIWILNNNVAPAVVSCFSLILLCLQKHMIWRLFKKLLVFICNLIDDLFWRIFCVSRKKMYILVLLVETFSKYLLGPFIL